MSKLNWSKDIPPAELTSANKQVLAFYSGGSPWVYFAKDIAAAIKNGFKWVWVSSDELVADSQDKSTTQNNNEELYKLIELRDLEILKLKKEMDDLKSSIKRLIE